MRKASSTTNIVDDLTSIFGGASSSGEFRDVEGKLKKDEERIDRHQRITEPPAVEISFSLFVCVYDYLYLSRLYKCRKPIQVH
ncbi:hypothetical protein IFM89_026861 [Coptis chinensis]|uniref:Uncharacterized protein n=1 Tax=Coptis chinensis TaxID=261450 RepID=A0A835HK40_9MAGN|nr:hypothetical protein IFM89_026861 [Coptis chinensis]